MPRIVSTNKKSTWREVTFWDAAAVAGGPHRICPAPAHTAQDSQLAVGRPALYLRPASSPRSLTVYRTRARDPALGRPRLETFLTRPTAGGGIANCSDVVTLYCGLITTAPYRKRYDAITLLRNVSSYRRLTYLRNCSLVGRVCSVATCDSGDPDIEWPDLVVSLQLPRSSVRGRGAGGSWPHRGRDRPLERGQHHRCVSPLPRAEDGLRWVIPLPHPPSRLLYLY